MVLLVGALVGAFNGLLIVRFGLNGFIVTLGMLIVLRGLLTGISGGQTFFALPGSMTYLGSTHWFGVPASIWVSLLLFAVGIVVLGYTRAGRALYAIGGNADAARAAGIRTDRVLWIALIVASMLAALAGLLHQRPARGGAAAQGDGAIFQVFAAAVIGGVSLNGGKGTVFGAFTGVLLLFMIMNVLTLAGVPAQWTNFLNGAVILVALVVSRITGGKAHDLNRPGPPGPHERRTHDRRAADRRPFPAQESPCLNASPRWTRSDVRFPTSGTATGRTR